MRDARPLLVLLVATACQSAVVAQTAGELIDRTLAIVSGQVITLSDVQTAAALGLLPGVDKNTAIESGTPQLIDRLLILREVQRYSPPEPAPAEIDAQLAALRARVGSDAELDRVLALGGFSEVRLRAWIRDDLRIAAYLRQRFSAAAGATEDVVEDWVAELRRRTPVIELWKTK
jgi:hypothetical protein